MRLNGYKRLWKLLPVAAALALSACTGHEEEIIRQKTDGDALVRFAIRVPGASVPASRAMDAGDENQVAEIDVLAFKPGGGEYVYSAKCDNINDGTGATKTFTVTLRQGNYDLVILANARDILSGATLTGETKADALATLTAGVPSGGKWPVDGSVLFPMWGDIGTQTVDESLDLATNSTPLLRMMARVDVQVSEDPGTFKLASVHVYNYNTKGAVVPGSASGWTADPGKVTVPTVPSASVLTEGPLLYDGTEIDETNNQCIREIYIMESENHTGDTHTAAKGLLERTCLVIGGTYSTDSKPTYYRVDFSTGSGVSQDYKDVLRNHKYMINITEVSGPGYETPDIAFRSSPVNIKAGVVQWNEGQGGEIYFDSQYYMSVMPKTVFNFYKSAGSETVTVMTDVPEGWKITRIDQGNGSGTWLTTDRTIDTYYGMGETPTALRISVTENGTEARTGYIYITAGRIEAKITVNQGVVTPTITAVLSTGGTTGEIGRSGGSHDIIVSSNVSSWVPVLYKSGVDHSHAVDTHFDTSVGSNDEDVTFTLYDSNNTDSPITYTIHFQDPNNSSVRSNLITVTHSHILPGIGDGKGTPPSTGVPATEGILAVNNLGQLNLDGQKYVNDGSSGITSNYIVYFKYGSTIALSAGSGIGDTYDVTDIAWAPEGFLGDINEMNTWASIYPWTTNTLYPTNTAINLAAGYGDPCQLAVRENKIGQYKTPSFPWGDGTLSANWITVDGVYGRMNGIGQFYPAAGSRNYNTGALGMFGNTFSVGYYWSNAGTISHAYRRAFNSNTPSLFEDGGGDASDKRNGFAVRCVTK